MTMKPFQRTRIERLNHHRVPILHLLNWNPLVVLIFCILQSCAPAPVRTTLSSLPGPDTAMSAHGCERFYSQLDQIIERAGVRDAEQAQIPGFPYLRTDRFLASFRTDVKSDAEFSAWVARLQSLDKIARGKELANLPSSALPQPLRTDYDNDRISTTIAECGALLSKQNLSDPQKRDNLRQNARVPPAYQTYKRVLGLYPITAQAVLWGVERLHKETALSFATPKQDLPIQGELLRYSPRSTEEQLNRRQVAKLIKASSANSLKIPEPEAADKQRLFNTFAPVWEIDVVSENDRIGVPRWSDAHDADD